MICTLNVTGYAQVRFRLACQPCICYLLPVNGLIRLPASLREGGGPLAVEGECDSSLSLKSTATKQKLHAGSFRHAMRATFLSEEGLWTAARSEFGGASPCPTISDRDSLCAIKNLPCPQAFQLPKANFTNSAGIHFKNPNRDSFHREASLRYLPEGALVKGSFALYILFAFFS